MRQRNEPIRCAAALPTAAQRRWKRMTGTVPVAGVAPGGVLVYGQFGLKHPGGNPMNESRYMVSHVRVATDRPWEEASEGIERQLGRFDPDVDQSLAAGGDLARVKARIEAMAGSSGFMLFTKHDHGSLLRIAGENRKAVRYVVGNPLFALRMTRHDIRAGLYAPLRVLLYENDEGETCPEYDKPSALVGQFGNAEVTAVSARLDRKLEEFVAEAIR
jgi:uncharacterized protein (DUF302 family)